MTTKPQKMTFAEIEVEIADAKTELRDLERAPRYFRDRTEAAVRTSLADRRAFLEGQLSEWRRIQAPVSAVGAVGGTPQPILFAAELAALKGAEAEWLGAVKAAPASEFDGGSFAAHEARQEELRARIAELEAEQAQRVEASEKARERALDGAQVAAS